MKKINVIFFLCMGIFFSCTTASQQQEKGIKKEQEPKIHTAYSTHHNEYENFNSNSAINKIASIENEYFKALEKGEMSRYYGTVWRQKADMKKIN